MTTINDGGPRCVWFLGQNLDGDDRWFAGCKADQGVSCYYKWRATVCPWCSKRTVDRDAARTKGAA